MDKKETKDIKDIFDNFDELGIPKQNTTAPSHDHYKFFLASSITKSGLISVGILFALIGIGGVALVNNFIGEGAKPVFHVLFIVIAVGVVIRIQKNDNVLIETFKDHMIVARHIPVGGKITNLIFMFKTLGNNFSKSSISYRNITSITRDTSFFSDGIVMINGVTDQGKKFQFPSSISLLEKTYDQKKIMEILRARGIKDIRI